MYDDPDFQVRREFPHITVAGATTDSGKFRSFQAFRLKKVHAGVITAGTTTAHGYDIYHGTTSIGAVLLGTTTVNGFASSALLNREVGSMEQVNLRSRADATGVVQAVYEYEILPSAVQS